MKGYLLLNQKVKQRQQVHIEESTTQKRFRVLFIVSIICNLASLAIPYHRSSSGAYDGRTPYGKFKIVNLRI